MMLKSTLNTMLSLPILYGSIFIRLSVVAFQIWEIPRNSPKIRT